jgi:hypothetical protein
MVGPVQHDSWFPPDPMEAKNAAYAPEAFLCDGTASGPKPRAPEEPMSGARLRGFLIALEDGSIMRCAEVIGFEEAEAAALDPRVAPPARLALVGPDEEAAAWLERWSEDAEQVRRRLVLCSAEGFEITLVATIASFGGGVPTSLAVESIRAALGGDILRSGVHPKVEVEAALARYDALARWERETQ